jgi:ubiquitin carboxyl-terminal hydrolase L3
MDSTPTASVTSASEQQSRQKWFPLESNPSLMNKFIATLGWDTNQYHIVDVFSTDDWALDMIPQPVTAVLLLYPLTPVQLQHEQQEKATLSAKTSPAEDVWFTKQRIGNACGTIGLLHAMLNVPKETQQSLPLPLILRCRYVLGYEYGSDNSDS